MTKCNCSDETTACCGSDSSRTVLLYACSGGANVGEIADLAARELMQAGDGAMFCQAGLGAGVEPMIQAARDADLNVVIDGCSMDCCKKVFDKQGLANYVQIKVTDLDIPKEKGARATGEQVAVTVAKVRTALQENS